MEGKVDEILARLQAIERKLDANNATVAELTESKRKAREQAAARTRRCRAKKRAAAAKRFLPARARGWISMIHHDAAFMERLQGWAAIGIRVLQRRNGGRDFVRWVTHEWMFCTYKPQQVNKTNGKLHFWNGPDRTRLEVGWTDMFGGDRDRGEKGYEIGWWDTSAVWSNLLIQMSQLPGFDKCRAPDLQYLKVLGSLRLCCEDDRRFKLPVPHQYEADGSPLMFEPNLLQGLAGAKIYARMRPQIRSALTACKHGLMRYLPGEMEKQGFKAAPAPGAALVV
jgi:hypothetical protein